MLPSILNIISRGHFDLQILLLQFISYTIIGFVVFPARGAAQAFVADQLGDSTGRYNGYMTMKPLVHIGWIGLITLYAVGLPLIEPVPIVPRNFRKPRSGYIMSILAGPVSGLLIAALAVGIYRICLLVVPSFSILLILRDLLLGCFAQNCVYLTVLMLLPLPFYDGYRILSLFLPAKWVYAIRQNGQIITWVVLLLLVTGALTPILDFFSNWIMRGIYFIFGL